MLMEYIPGIPERIPISASSAAHTGTVPSVLALCTIQRQPNDVSLRHHAQQGAGGGKFSQSIAAATIYRFLMKMQGFL